MALNNKPIFAGAPLNFQVPDLKTANTSYDGTGTATLLLTAPADGLFIDRIMLRPKGTNVVTVARLFLVDGADNSVAAGNTLIDEVLLPATTAANAASLTPAFFNNVGALRIKAGLKLYLTVGTTVAGGYSVTAFCGSLTA